MYGFIGYALFAWCIVAVLFVLPLMYHNVKDPIVQSTHPEQKPISKDSDQNG